jgi:hypothetical protein
MVGERQAMGIAASTVRGFDLIGLPLDVGPLVHSDAGGEHDAALLRRPDPGHRTAEPGAQVEPPEPAGAVGKQVKGM